MKCVYKYPLALTAAQQDVEMPIGAEVLHAGTQQGEIYIWALGDPERHTERRTFQVLGTGHTSTYRLKHVGTSVGPRFVWHVFEILPDQEAPHA